MFQDWPGKYGCQTILILKNPVHPVGKFGFDLDIGVNTAPGLFPTILPGQPIPTIETMKLQASL